MVKRFSHVHVCGEPMSTSAVRMLILTLLSVVMSNAAPAASADPLADIPEVVAEVNGQKILRTELIRELVGSSGTDALDRLVRRKLVEQAAKAAGVTASDEDIEREFHIDKRDLMEELIRLPWAEKNQGQFPIEEIIRARFRMSVEEYKQNVIRQKLLIQRCVAKDYQPSEEQLREVYNNPANYEFFQPPAKFRACHILITPLDPRDFFRGHSYQSSTSQMSQIKNERERRIDLYRDHNVKLENAPSIGDIDPAWRRAREKAEKVLADINARVITWDQALRQHTQDPHDQEWYDAKERRKQPPWRQMLKPPLPPGDVGYFHANGPLVKEFYEAAKKLKAVGDIGGPIRTEYGYHLIKLTEIQKQQELTFEQCRPRIERLSLEKYIEVRSTTWIAVLVDAAELKTRRSSLWPPLPSAGIALDPGGNLPDAGVEADPIVGTVNGEALKRSEVWRDLIQSDGDEGLKRLMNREIIITMLKEMGLERMEWECAHPHLRPRRPPQMKPINTVRIKDEPVPIDVAIDFKLNEDRLSVDSDNKERAAKKEPELSFREYIFQRYGQTEKDYRRAIEAGLILTESIRKRIPTDEQTLQLFFALTRDAYAEPDWFEVSHILIVPEGGMKNADKNALLKAVTNAEQVRRTYALAPDQWNQLVSLYSNDSAENKARGGSLGACYYDDRSTNIPDGQALHLAIVEQRLQPQVGMASTPIKTSRGFHIVKIDKVHRSRAPEFDELKTRLQRDYINERAKMYTDVWLRALKRTLTKQAAVKNHLYPEPDTAEIEDGLPPDGPLPLPRE